MMGTIGEVIIITCSVVVTLCLTAWSYRCYLIEPSIDWTVDRIHLRLLLAAPLLSILCGVALLIMQVELICECFLSVFEGYALYMFFCLMVLHVGSKNEVVAFLDQQPLPLEWKICNCIVLKRFNDGKSCFDFLRVSVLQYMVIKPMLVLLLFIAVHATTTDQTLKNLQAVTKTLALTSLIVALGALLYFYRCLNSALESFKWLPQRFLCIKLLVFLVTVQKIIMSIAFSDFPSNPRDETSKAVEVYLVILLFEAPFYALLLNRYFGSTRSSLSSAEDKIKTSALRAICDVLRFDKLLPEPSSRLNSASSDSIRARSAEDSSLVRAVSGGLETEAKSGLEMTTNPHHANATLRSERNAV